MAPTMHPLRPINQANNQVTNQSNAIKQAINWPKANQLSNQDSIQLSKQSIKRPTSALSLNSNFGMNSVDKMLSVDKGLICCMLPASCKDVRPALSASCSLRRNDL